MRTEPLSVFSDPAALTDEIARLRAEVERLTRELAEAKEASIKLTLSFADPDEEIEIEVHGTEQHIRRLGLRVSFWAQQENEVALLRAKVERLTEANRNLHASYCHSQKQFVASEQEGDRLRAEVKQMKALLRDVDEMTDSRWPGF